MSREVSFVAIKLKPGARDVRGSALAQALKSEHGIDAGHVHAVRLYALATSVPNDELEQAASAVLADEIVEEVEVGRVTTEASCFLMISRLPGVTDDEGKVAQQALADHLPQLAGKTQTVFAQRLYLFEKSVPRSLLEKVGQEKLGNPIVDRIEVGDGTPAHAHAAVVHVEPHKTATYVELPDDDAVLLDLGNARGLALNLDELSAIRSYYRRPEVAEQRAKRGLPASPTDCELECFAQTWSEHCKHKEFNASIAMENAKTGETFTVDSLFKSYIRKSTEEIRAKYSARGEDWMVTVFSDNAGVVHLDDERLFVLKVETHNSPSALDPVGGAMTGILGTHRDAFGTGKGGARLLFNTNVLCFGPRGYGEKLLKGQLHPTRVMDGVVTGIEAGGNKCGVPTVNGAIVFDARYSGKPLVYCGTGAVMKKTYAGALSHVKEILPGDVIVLIGGPTGKDGIHGATYSSVQMTDGAPRSIVQIGSPFTQKLASDFLEVACDLGLVSGCTDNGAGGLSSSIGELALSSGGAKVDLTDVPLKYAGLEPWEIFLSESQERMSLAVRPVHLPALLDLARKYAVDATVIGKFTNTGELDVSYKGATILSLSLSFLHDGVPRKFLRAKWTPPAAKEPTLGAVDPANALLALLSSDNICSRESVIRQYDHEVKGLSVVKPLMGERGTAPQDAGVLRTSFDSFQGLAVASGIAPKYGDLDPYEMSAGSFDEALRSLVSVGARLPEPGAPVSISACDNFCVPDSVYDEARNPGGHQKLGCLVRMCQALYDMATFFDVPMTSGKDSMKNDFRADGVTISVPPTVLYTVVGTVDDVRHVTTAEFKKAGDVIFLLGETYDELGASEFYRLQGVLGANVPRVRKEAAKDLYLRIQHARKENPRVFVSSHDLSDGGLAVALSECTFGRERLGAQIDLPEGALSTAALLFAESHSRLLVTVDPAHAESVQTRFGPRATRLGVVTGDGLLSVKRGGSEVIRVETARLLAAFRGGPV
ncbi:MAG: AIR synthase-related protein [Polyangiaceae bacterium]